MSNDPYEVVGGGAGYGAYHRRRREPRPASEEAAAAVAYGHPVPAGVDGGYMVGGEAPLEAAPMVEGFVAPEERRRRKLLVVVLAVAAGVAAVVLVVGQIVFKPESPSPSPSEPLPTLPESGP